MDVAEVVALAEQIDGLVLDQADRRTVCASLAAADRLAAWVEARRLALAQRLAALVPAPELTIAETARADVRTAERLVSRGRTAQAAPDFGAALEDGRIAAEHLDQLTTSLRRLPATKHRPFLAESERLVHAAERLTPDRFGQALRREERRLADDDGTDRFRRQQEAVRLHRRVDVETGMHIWTLRLDPLNAVKLDARIRSATEALFHDRSPEGCPGDPVEKQAFLRAHALLGLLEGKGGSRAGRPEITAVIDLRHPAPEPVVDWGLPVELPVSVLQRLWPEADVGAVVVEGGVIVHAPGVVDLGRATRLASRAQRRALRALYPTCALPGCDVRFDVCTVHHVTWWRHGGTTDLQNLLPVCTRHHHRVHDDGWRLHLARDRTLTVTLPDGTTMATGPPARVAASAGPVTPRA